MKTRKFYQLNRWHHGFAGAYLKGYEAGFFGRPIGKMPYVPDEGEEDGRIEFLMAMFEKYWKQGYADGTLDRNRKRCAVRSCKATFKKPAEMRWCERCGNRMCVHCEIFTGDGFVCRACHGKQNREMDFGLFSQIEVKDVQVNEPEKKRLPGFNGECKMCGQCCRTFNLPLSPDELEEARMVYFATGFPGAVCSDGAERLFEKEVAAWIFRHVVKNDGPGYRCNLVTAGNLCPLHGTKAKPSTCIGYGEWYIADPKQGCGHWEGFEAERREAMAEGRKGESYVEGYYPKEDWEAGQEPER